MCVEMLTEEENPTFRLGHSRWMSAMHVVYNDNREDVKKELHRLFSATDFHVGFITHHYKSCN